MSESIDNIDKFDFYVTQIFGFLYSNFPVPKDLNVSKFITGDLYRTFDNGARLPSEENEFFMSVVGWLSDSGFIKIRKIYSNEGASDAVLTANALNALRLTPSSLDSDKSFGEIFKSAAKIGTLEASKAAINKCVAAGIFAIGTLFN